MIPYLTAVLLHKCPRCREGNLFTHKWYQLSKVTNMPQECAVCKQKMEVEPGFYYGTGYVSYALTVAFTVSTFVAWWILAGFSIKDNSIFWWIGTNASLLIALQPWFMRTSRAIWLSWFYHKDDERLSKLSIVSNTHK
jgi:uncharacterized protein (DUF983 family)